MRYHLLSSSQVTKREAAVEDESKFVTPKKSSYLQNISSQIKEFKPLNLNALRKQMQEAI